MKIKFPFAVRQTKPDTVEIETHPNGRPLVQIEFHESLEIKEEKYVELHDYVATEAVKASIKVTQ